MGAADKKTTYTAAEVALLESTIQTQQNQIQAQQVQIDELKRKNVALCQWRAEWNASPDL